MFIDLNWFLRWAMWPMGLLLISLIFSYYRVDRCFQVTIGLIGVFRCSLIEKLNYTPPLQIYSTTFTSIFQALECIIRSRRDNKSSWHLCAIPVYYKYFVEVILKLTKVAAYFSKSSCNSCHYCMSSNLVLVSE